MSPLPPVSRTDLDHILDHTRDLWGDLNGERIFITGGTGFVGCWLLESFTWAVKRLGLDAQAIVLTRSPDAFRQKAPHLAGHRSVTLIQGDVRTFDFPHGTFSHVIHAATESSAKLNAENPLLMLDTIIEGTRHTLDFAVSHDSKKLLLTSSGAVYGKHPPDLTHIPEDFTGAYDPMNLNSAYGQGKRLAEHICAQYSNQNGIEVKIARGFAFVGPYLPLDLHLAIGNFIRDGLNGGPIVVKGDGTPYRSYLYAADLTIWLWTLLFQGRSCRPYNVGSENPLSISELAQQVAFGFSSNIDVKIMMDPQQGKPPERYIPSTRRANLELGLDEHITLRQGISRSINYFRGNNVTPS
jgi:nucleoside-diphosphate-sugar epimerase